MANTNLQHLDNCNMNTTTRTTWEKWKSMANTKLLCLHNWNTNNEKKKKGFRVYKIPTWVEIVEVLFHLGLVFVTTTSSHTFWNMRHIFGKPIILQDYKNINFKLVHIFWNKTPYLGNFFLAKNTTKARTTCKLEKIDIYIWLSYTL